MSKIFRPGLQQKIPEDAYCEKHRELLQLFCDDDQTALCGKCFQSQEHKHHLVSGVREASEKYGGEEQNFKEIIESELRIMFRVMIEEYMVYFQSLQGYTFDLKFRAITLNQLTGFAKEVEKSQEVLQKLNELGRENMNKLKESEVRVYKEICSLQEITEKLEKCEGSPFMLLQNARYFLKRSESLLTQCLQPAHVTDLSLFQITGLSKWVKVFQRLVTLDPKTAHPCLVLSKDLRSIGLRYVQQLISGNPGRFDFSATVLSVESFTSGRHYWEVDVEKAAEWQLGICEDFANRKSAVPKASKDTILLTRSVMGTQCTYWVSPPLKKVSLREQMHKVGVFLDYEWGQIAFYDMTERSLIYNFSNLTFHGALRPMFSLCIPNRGTISDSLSICLPQFPPYNVTVGPPSS